MNYTPALPDPGLPLSVVLRIEHPTTGHGPFGKQNPKAHRNALSLHTIEQQLPEAFGDVRGFDCGRHVCGCTRMADMQKWFGPFLPQLHAAGFVLVAYEVRPDALFLAASDVQVGFDRAGARVCACLRLNDWPTVEQGAEFDLGLQRILA